MSIRKLLREALLAESMDVYIKGYDYQNQLDTLSDIKYYIQRHATQYLIELIGEEKLEEYRTYNFFEYDGGSSPYDDRGIINFYIWDMPEELVKHTFMYIQKLMKEKDILIMPRPIEPSNSMKSKVLRMEVHPQKIKNEEDFAPEINMSNANAFYFFTEVLKYSTKEFQYGEFKVKDLMTRIEFAMNNMDLADYQDKPEVSKTGNITHYKMGYDQKAVNDRLNLMKELCQYAIKNNYDTIMVN
jgi:hypothetical protein